MANELKPWKYDIQYGPEGEANYAWVYDDHGVMVATMKTHKAKEIVERMNTRPAAPVECHPRDTNSVEYHETRNVAAKTVEGLERYDISMFGNGAVEMGGGEYVRFDQAEAIIAAERAEKDEWRKRYHATHERLLEADEKLQDLQTDNAALTARVEASEKEVDRLQTARVFDGWLYHNPDTGTEWAEQHPIVSGEVPDAKEVRAATATAFQNELIPAWEDLAKETSRRKTLETQLAAAKKALTMIAKIELSFPEELRDIARAALEVKP